MRRLTTTYLVLWLSLALNLAPAHAVTNEVGCTLLLGHVADESIPKELSVAMSKLRYEDEIPENLLQTYDSRTLGEAVARWVSKREEALKLNPIASTEVDLLNGTQIILHFSPADSGAIWGSSYKNQHETGRSAGTFNPDLRRNAEDAFTGLKMGKSTESLVLRPKSSFLHVSHDKPLGRYYGNVPGHYGAFAAVLKDKVKRRSLWVAGDSLNIAHEPRTERQLMQARGSFYRGRLPSNPYEGFNSYMEAVTYGEIDLSDVDHFIAFEGSSLPLKKFGLPVFRVKHESRYGRQHYVYTQLLYKGDRFPESLPKEEWLRLQRKSKPLSLPERENPSALDRLEGLR